MHGPTSALEGEHKHMCASADDNRVCLLPFSEAEASISLTEAAYSGCAVTPFNTNKASTNLEVNNKGDCKTWQTVHDSQAKQWHTLLSPFAARKIAAVTPQLVGWLAPDPRVQ
jgi:hypothetical protein